MLPDSSSKQARKYRCVEGGRIWLACLLVYATPVFAQDTYSFDIETQDVTSALIEFAEQADLTLVFPDELVKGKISNVLRGQFSREEGIQALLAGTGLTPRFSNRTMLTISAAAEKQPTGAGEMNQPTRKGLLAAIASVFTAAGAAQAQEVDAAKDDENAAEVITLDEIIVSAYRRDQRLLDVPSSITAYGQDFIEQRSIDNIQDLINVTPNITTRTVELFGENSTYTIRGISGGGLTTASTGVYLDDVPLTFGVGSNEPQIRTFDLERVEILRGPQGTLYGAGAMGGAIRYISNRPNFNETEGQVRVDFGDTDHGDSSFAFDGMLNLPIVQDKAALRLTASFADLGGYIDYPNSSDGNIQDGNDSKLDSIRADLAIRATDKLSLNIQAWSQKSESNALNVVSAGSSSLYDNDAFVNTLGGADNEFEQFSVVVKYAFDWADLVSSTSYVETVSDASFAVFAPVEFDGITDGISHETRLVSISDSSPWQWVAGLFYQDAEYDRTLELPAFGVRRSGLEEREQLSVFGELTYAFSDALNATIGLRHFTEDVKITDQRSFGGMTAPAQIGDSDTDKTVPKFSMTYSGFEDVLIYGSISQGFRVGGVNLLPAPGTLAPASYDSDELWAYEIGAKFSNIVGGLSGSLAVFRIDWDDKQSFTPQFGFPVVINLGKAEITGVEVELSYRFSDQLSIGLNGSLMSAESAETDPSVGTVDGQRLARIPEGSAALFINYSRPVRLGSNDWDLSIAADGSFVGDQVTNVPIFPLFKEEHYTTNARVALASESWEFALYARNLNNDNTVSFFDPTNLNVPRPRTVGVEIVSRF